MQTLAALPQKKRSFLTLPVFTATIFLSALLIFSIQPMFSKMVLPLLGGSPSVWNTAMVFFQACLLAGYLYAHLLVRYVPLAWQMRLHLCVMVLGFMFVPFALNTAFLPSADGFIPLSVLLLYATSIGYPFFALSANAPLLQSWFSRSGHKDAHDPYFLYGASNIGSALALLSYPLIIEPFLSINGQTTIWGMGYGALGVCILLCALTLQSKQTPSSAFSAENPSKSPEMTRPEVARPDISLKLALRWILAAAIPSSLMLGVTTHITTNVAAAPFLWVLPLTLYLFTFVLVFDRKGGLPVKWLVRAHGVFLISVVLFGSIIDDFIVLSVVLHLSLFFTSALICHRDLAVHRPNVKHLTAFYLLMSLGGVIGGALTALVAPLVFSSVFEYPLMIAVACLFLPASAAYLANGFARTWLKDAIFVLGVSMLCAAMTFLGVALIKTYHDKVSAEISTIGLLLVLVAVLAFLRSMQMPVRAAMLTLAMTLIASQAIPQLFNKKDQVLVEQERSFFGVFRVTSYVRPDGLTVHKFNHGDTVHNMQLRGEGYETIPLAYYHTDGPFAQAIKMARTRTSAPAIASIGLGAGALACYVKPLENWVFYEIDQAVVDMARDENSFSYISKCAPQSPIVVGDARLKVAQEADGSFDLIIVDAFSSNSIPAHLLTLEAIDMYLAKLKPGGVVFFHVSNRFADVGSVVIAAANKRGLESRYSAEKLKEDTLYKELKSSVVAVVIGDKQTIEQSYDTLAGWQKAEANPAAGMWTDDFSNVFGALLAKHRGGPILGASN